jgi:hypothetical protein
MEHRVSDEKVAVTDRSAENDTMPAVERKGSPLFWPSAATSGCGVYVVSPVTTEAVPAGE